MPSSTSSTAAAAAAELQRQSLQRAAAHFGVPAQDIVLPADADIVLDSVRFHYLDWGNSGKRDVVFLHGAALTAHTWDLVCLALRTDYRCLALDHRGHGDSEWPANRRYGLHAHAADVEAFVAALELERPVVVGMSMGGMAAMQYAASHSDSLGGLVLVDVGTNPPRAQGLARLRSFVATEHEHDSVEGFIDQALRFNPRRDPELLRVSLTHNLRQLASGRWTWKYDREHALGGSAEEYAKTMRTLEQRLPSVQCPTLIVRGAESDLFFDEDAEAMATMMPHARWVRIEGAGHTVQGDNPRDLAEALRTFLGEIAA